MRPMLATELYAISQGSMCKGDFECHWCGAPCGQLWRHDDPFPVLHGPKMSRYCKRPSSPWICKGCWLFRRNSVTMNFISEGYLDRQKAENHSWLITDHGMWGIRLPEDGLALYEQLLSPHNRFVLSLIAQPPNRIQYAFANDIAVIQNNTPLLFTINNIPHTYTIYELKESLKHNHIEGAEPGIRELIKLLGPVPKLEQEAKEEYTKNNSNKRGRPIAKTDGRSTKTAVTLSGQPLPELSLS